MTMINLTALCLAMVITSLIIKGICKEFIPNTAYKKHINNFISVVWLMYLGAMAGVYLERNHEPSVGYTYEDSVPLLESIYTHGFIHGMTVSRDCPDRINETYIECGHRHMYYFNGTGNHGEDEKP